MENEGLYTVYEFAELADIGLSSLRRYIRKSGIKPAEQRGKNGRSLYRDEDLTRAFFRHARFPSERLASIEKQIVKL